MISTQLSRHLEPAPIGVSAVSTFQPPWILPNEWFETIGRKFVKHTGILQRPISMEDEVELAIHATENLMRETGCDLRNCVGLVFTSPSFVPMPVARRYMDKDRAQQEQLDLAAARFVERMGIQPRQLIAVNNYCAGYATALSTVIETINPAIDLQPNEFILVLTASRISRITDYSCRQSSALFGDLATATVISRLDSTKYPVHFELLGAHVEQKPTNRPFFQFSLRKEVLAPTYEGGQRFDPERIVFSLDGMGIADAAPRAMASAASDMLDETGLAPENIDYIVPHQAGSGIVRFAEMKLREAGFTAEVINGMTRDVGNVSSGSVPYTLGKLWQQLDGTILCPIASVGPPGECVVAQGCIALRSTAIHRALSYVA
jgi:3-oxoacyl-[acyl-carrier-protein] synthase III